MRAPTSCADPGVSAASAGLLVTSMDSVPKLASGSAQTGPLAFSPNSSLEVSNTSIICVSLPCAKETDAWE